MPSLNLSAYLIIALLLSISGWTVDRMRLSAKVESVQAASVALQATINANAAEYVEKARVIEHEHAQALQTINQTLLDTEAKNAQLENNRNAAIARGTQRVYVRASCPSSGGGTASTAAAGGINDAAVELDSAYRSTLSDLRRGVESDAAKIIGLQAYAHECVRVCGDGRQSQ